MNALAISNAITGRLAMGRQEPPRSCSKRRRGSTTPNFARSGQTTTSDRRVWSVQMWNSLRDELREILWLVSMISGLSIMGVGLAVVLAQA